MMGKIGLVIKVHSTLHSLIKAHIESLWAEKKYNEIEF